MKLNSNGNMKNFDRKLNFYFEKGLFMEGFRKNTQFIDSNFRTLSMISDKNWEKHPYMHKTYSISSPKKDILYRYYCIVLHELMKYQNDFKKINIYHSGKIDSISYKIFMFLKNVCGKELTFKCIKFKEKNIINENNMRIAVKRGFFNEFKNENTVLDKVYGYYSNVFYNKLNNLDEMIYVLNQNCSNNYEKWLLIRLIFNILIRNKRFEEAELYLKKLREITPYEIDYINSKAFLILVTLGEKSSLKYLRENINIDFLANKRNVDISESLILKNYATLLDIEDCNKEYILRKCIDKTPYDVDLIKYYNKLYNRYKKTDLISILKSGYLDMELFALCEVKDSELDLLEQFILFSICKGCCLEKEILLKIIKNSKIFKYLSHYIDGKQYQINELEAVYDVFI